MAEFFKNLSKNALAMIIIAGSVLFIVVSDPPVTKCSHQIKKFEEAEVGNLLKAKGSVAKETRFEKLIGICKQTNTLGGCYELFDTISRSLDRSRTISLDCIEDWGDSSLAQKLVNESMKVMMEVAWGAKPPESNSDRLSWYQSPQLSLFCRLIDTYKVMNGAGLSGERAWEQKREKLLAGLPGFAEVGREQAWSRSLLSVNCSAYRRMGQ